MRNVQGATLVELLIASLLTCVIALIATRLLLLVVHHDEQQQQQVSQQQALELARHDLLLDSRRAGFAFCLPFSRLHLGNAIETRKTKTHRQVLQLRYIEPLAYLLTAIDESTTTLPVNRPLPRDTKTRYLLTDCQHSDTFQFSASHRHSPLQHAYAAGSFIGKIVERRYFVQKTTRKTPNGKPIYALYLGQTDQQELVENITQLTIYYGVIQGQQVQFIPSTPSTIWRNKPLLQLHLTATSGQQLTADVNLRNNR